MISRLKWTMVLLPLSYFLLTAATVTAQKQKVIPKEQGERERPIAIVNLISRSRSLSPEFAADVLIRVSQSNKVADKRWKKEILEEAFRFTEDAQNPVRRKVVPFPSYPVDTQAHYLSYAFGLKLDTLSLRSRILSEMLNLDKQRAKRLLAEVPLKLPLRQQTCSEAFVYDVSDFYEVLSKIADESFNEREIVQRERLAFLTPYIENVSSPVQITPVTKLILSFKSSPDEFDVLVQSFTSTLKKISGDDRSFGYSTLYDLALRNLYELTKTYGEKTGLPNDMEQAFRIYLTKNLTGHRCADNLQQYESYMSREIAGLNEVLFGNSPVVFADLKATEVHPSPNRLIYYQSSETRELLRKVRILGTSDDPGFERERKTPEWQQDFNEALAALEEWDGKREKTELDYFHQKCVLYNGLIKRAAKGTAKETTIRRYMSFLNQLGFQKENRIEWFMYVDMLLKELSSGEDRIKELQILSESSNSTISLYADLIKLQP